MNTTICIPSARAHDLNSEVARLNRRATRMGIAPIVLSLVSTGEKNVDGIPVPASTFAIAGNLPTFKGWSFLATVEALESGKNIFHGIAAVPSRFERTGHACEHCNQNRKRNSSFILAHEGGDHKQVGSTCINDFLGGNALKEFAFFSDSSTVLREFSEESFRGAADNSVRVLSILELSAAAIDKGGFVKKSGWDEFRDTVPTVFVVEAAMWGRPDQRLIVTESQEAKAVATRDWLVSLEGSQNDYLQKLIDLAACQYVDKRNVGILVSAIAAFDREQEKQSQAKASPSNHIGTVGKRETFVASLTGCKTLPDYGYGTSNLYSFKDADGNVLKWKTQGDFEFTIGEPVKITGSVKKHGEWNGVKETELTRCKVA